MANYKQILLRVTPEVLEQINEKHAQYPFHISMNEYIIHCILQDKPILIQHNYDAITEYKKEISRIKKLIWPVVALLTSTGQATQKDVETIVSLLEMVVEEEKKLLNDTRKEEERMHKIIKNAVKTVQKQEKDGAL